MTDDERFAHETITQLTPIEPSAQLRRLVAQIPIEHPRTISSFWPFGSLWVPSLSLAAAGLLGLFVGQGWSSLLESDVSASSLAHVSESSVSMNPEALTKNLPLDDADLDDADLDDLIMMATAADFSPDDWDLFMTSTHPTLTEEPY